MNSLHLASEVETKLARARELLSRELAGTHRACLTCSFQAEDVLLAKLALEFDRAIPILFLDTGYHFAETYAYRDRIADEWDLSLINLLPAKTVLEQEGEHGLLYQAAPDQCCKLRKVEPLFSAVARLSRLADRTSARTGKEPRCAGRVGAFHTTQRAAGFKAGAPR